MCLILALLLLSYSVSASAQEASLFPELEGFTALKSADTSIEVQTAEPSPLNEEDLFQPSIPQKKETQPLEETPEQEDEKDDRYILWTIDNVNATLTPNPVTSYCSASLGVVNMLKKELKDFSGSFTVGDTTKAFRFSNLGKEKAAAYKYVFVGTACEQILNIPNMNIKTCKVDGWSEKKCKTKVKYLKLGENKVL